jgi:hypothetical protein
MSKSGQRFLKYKKITKNLLQLSFISYIYCKRQAVTFQMCYAYCITSV